MEKNLSNQNNKVVTFGEVILRLSPTENRKMQQTNSLNFFFGGTEMNVAASLANFGLNVQHVSTVSDDFVGDAAISNMRQVGIDTTAIKKNGFPLGIYFLEAGAGMRSGKIAYNRLNGSFANIQPSEVDWEEILKDCKYFHWTGISPAISETAYLTLKQGLKVAKQNNIIVSADPAYRSNLWKYGRSGREVLAELMEYSNIFIGGVNEINELLQTEFKLDKEDFIAASKRLMIEFPNVQKIFDKVRTGISASWQKVYGRSWINEEYYATNELEIYDVVDRIGTGDAYAAGLLYGLQNYDDKLALEFANASCALKHTILGDANLVSVEEVMEIVQGKIEGRIKR